MSKLKNTPMHENKFVSIVKPVSSRVHRGRQSWGEIKRSGEGGDQDMKVALCLCCCSCGGGGGRLSNVGTGIHFSKIVVERVKTWYMSKNKRCLRHDVPSFCIRAPVLPGSPLGGRMLPLESLYCRLRLNCVTEYWLVKMGRPL